MVDTIALGFNTSGLEKGYGTRPKPKAPSKAATVEPSAVPGSPPSAKATPAGVGTATEPSMAPRPSQPPQPAPS